LGPLQKRISPEKKEEFSQKKRTLKSGRHYHEYHEGEEVVRRRRESPPIAAKEGGGRKKGLSSRGKKNGQAWALFQKGRGGEGNFSGKNERPNQLEGRKRKRKFPHFNEDFRAREGKKGFSTTDEFLKSPREGRERTAVLVRGCEKGILPHLRELDLNP